MSATAWSKAADSARRRDVQSIHLVDAGGQRAGERAFARPEVQHAPRPVGDDPFQDVEHLGRIRRPVLVSVRDVRVAEGRGQSAPVGRSVAHSITILVTSSADPAARYHRLR